jgi:hypothetical protein
MISGGPELCVGGQIGGDPRFEYPTRYLIDPPHPDRTAMGRCDEQCEHPTGHDAETRPHVCQGRCAGAIVCDQLPEGGRAALEADAVRGGGERQRGGQRGGRSVKPEEARGGRLQRRQRNPRDESPAAETGCIRVPEGPTGRTLLADLIRVLGFRSSEANSRGRFAPGPGDFTAQAFVWKKRTLLG